MSGDSVEDRQSLVEKILEQGQVLRNSMVQSILQNDPFYMETLDSKIFNTPVTSVASITDRPNKTKHLLNAFVSGEYLTRDQEEIALNTIRSMPPLEFCQANQKGKSNCFCVTCTAYHVNNLKCDLRREETNENVHKVKNDTLKHVDSLKVILQSIHLNDLGNKKVMQAVNKRQCLHETYFVEYDLPEVFTKEVPRSRSKVDSGLEKSHVRLCARRTENVIHIKQAFIHSISNVYNYNLDDYDLTFYVRYKTTGLKKSELLGIAKFNLGLFKSSDSASCGRSLPIRLSEESPISIGSLKVTLQLGCGKLYFGQEFLDAILSPQSPSQASSFDDNLDEIANRETIVQTGVQTDKKVNKNSSPTVEGREISSRNKQSIVLKRQPNLPQEKLNHDHKDSEGEILFGFLYISEARFLNSYPSSYILCQPYCQNDISCSRVVYDNLNPVYNFCQNVPLLYEDSLLLNLRENFMIIEFWSKTDRADDLFGLTKLPLHQFYLGFRNSIILKHLKRNKLPIIGTDWWEPVYSVDDNKLIGQVQVLTAVGTDEQIRNLEVERGFKEDIVKAKFPVVTKLKNDANYFRDRARLNVKSPKTGVKKSKTLTSVNHPVISSTTKEILRVDVAVQSDLSLKMEDKCENGGLKSTHSQDMLQSFLKLLEQKQRPSCVENGTNTEITGTSTSDHSQVAKTTDLLDSLQKALSLDNNKPITKSSCFKAQISINAANQLPSRRKIRGKFKRGKGKSPKGEEKILPSTYVTFETMPEGSVKITNIFPKSTSPQWNYKCDVELPMDLLTNGQKRLIFKVWKKSTNVVLQPNMQRDLVLGFAALDLSVLSAGLPNVQGWFNIIDFSGKCNGQINIHVNPLEKIEKTSTKKSLMVDTINANTPNSEVMDKGDCNEILGRALKRKFTELDEITQRLRLRLSEVVSEDSEGSTDDVAEEFEHDINSIVVEDDFDMIDFEKEARKLGVDHNSRKPLKAEGSSNEASAIHVDTNDDLPSGSSGLLIEKMESGNVTDSSTSRSAFSDKHLAQGKHRIDSLLEKLSLITAEVSNPFSSRYVSGCSVISDNSNVQEIFTDLDQHSRPNITAANSLDPVLFQQLYGVSMSAVSKGGADSASAGSETSVITNFSEGRPKPDGEGTSNDKET